MTRHSTAIEWTHIPNFKGETWNPVIALDKQTGKRGWHCEHASPGCINCYAERQNIAGARGGTTHPFTRPARDLVDIQLHDETLTAPLHWKTPRAIFVCSMSDLFGDFVSDDMIDRVFAIAALCPQHIFIVLTKRAKRMREWVASSAQPFPDAVRADDIAGASITLRDELPLRAGLLQFSDEECLLNGRWPLPNVWLGVSTEDQRRADERIPDLLATPAAVRFVSYEPALEQIDITRIEIRSDRNHSAGAPPAAMLNALEGIQECFATGAQKQHASLDWVICGGESGKNARPMHPDWARSIRDQCAAADVPFFFKQWGEWTPGENTNHAQISTERTADWFNGLWHFSSITPKQSQETHIDDEPDLYRVGKKRAGRLLDGVEHNAFPRQSAINNGE